VLNSTSSVHVPCCVCRNDVVQVILIVKLMVEVVVVTVVN
jgi:hypothetical protein